ncbi:hypothetical protein [Erythrobacter sp. SG61-1L]|uniref:hypothetical protein n=1 Tax=Erythrobacter sp. SG61-1L TaxID=1603897 RepID=UPI0012E24ACB|nr:hypothetical protein [Erythrobacter sp. SG61-1L]
MVKICLFPIFFLFVACASNGGGPAQNAPPVHDLSQFIRSAADSAGASEAKRTKVRLFLSNSENDYFLFGTFLKNEETPELGCRDDFQIMVMYDKKIGPRNVKRNPGHPEAPYREAIVSGIPKSGDFSTIFGALLFTTNFVIEDARVESYTGRTC